MEDNQLERKIMGIKAQMPGILDCLLEEYPNIDDGKAPGYECKKHAILDVACVETKNYMVAAAVVHDGNGDAHSFGEDFEDFYSAWIYWREKGGTKPLEVYRLSEISYRVRDVVGRNILGECPLVLKKIRGDTILAGAADEMMWLKKIDLKRELQIANYNRKTKLKLKESNRKQYKSQA